MVRPVLFFFLAVVLLPCGIGYAENKACPVPAERRVLTEADTLRTWGALHRSYTRYQSCDDGAIAEGYSESVARILVDHWSTLPLLADLAKKDHNFLLFVLRHVDATDDEKDLHSIKTDANSQCPTALRNVCDELAKQADSALKEAASYR